MSTTETRGMCEEVAESLSALLDGTASARLFDHVAECDECRDLKHEAQAAAERVRDAGADFRPADDFVAGLIGRLEAARPASSGPTAPRAATTTIEATPVVVQSDAVEPGAETAPTVFDPLAAAKVAEAEESARPRKSGDTQPSARLPAGPTREEAPAAIAVAPVAGAPKADAPASAAMARTQHDPSATPAPAVDAAPAPVVPKAPVAARRTTNLRRPAAYAAGALAMAAAAAIGFSLKSGSSPTSATKEPWSGTVATVARASADKSGGLEVCSEGGGGCAVVASGGAVKKGSVLRTDARTRARVTLADGTELSIDRGSEVELSGGKDRAARVKRGTVVADVAHVEGSTARFAFPRGEVEVLGTKLSITAADERASVEVARGAVRVRSDRGRTVEVRAGEEATIIGGGEPVVASSSTMADTMEWSEHRGDDAEAPVLRGLGELRARKPGQTQEKDRAVRLAKHSVKARVVDIVARTEVDETFTNDTDEELEGIYRFPLPPGAQIEKLALEVDGKLIEGAFVDRDRGAAIWRGVIQNAAPKAPKPREEIIWVPGPWRDPALLEWQRGGRFELKIFPIPRRGSRRVVLTYTQTVDQSAGIRRFTYPLAHDPSGSTRVGSFDMDVQVLGLDKSVGLTMRGYDLKSAGEGDRRVLHADDFVPAGDLTVEYALPDRDKEVTAWAYAPVESFLPHTATVTETRSAKPVSAEERAAQQAAVAMIEDRSPYVAVALRPRLPRWQEAKERLHVLVVDSSRSMFGERFARATKLSSSIVREMDRRDSFVLLACDTTCKAMSGGVSPQPSAPGPAAAGEVERFLRGIEPDGGSDLAAAISAARAAAGAIGGKELRIVYLGDGTPSVGPTRPAHLEAAVRHAVPTGDAAVITVPLGADADTVSLAALARAGGGVMVPYVPGQKVSTAALEVLSAAYGVMLRDVEVELPAGLGQVSPAKLDPIRAGGETIVVARMSAGNEVSGSIKLRGKVAGERFEQTYPLKVLASGSAGNAFVPRLYAAAKIAEIERSGGDAQKPTAIELSKRFAVASRYTSLLVLESEAMFKAFGLDRVAQAPAFTGEQQAESASSESDSPRDDALGGPAAAATAGPGMEKGKADRANPYSGDGFGSGHGRLGGGAAPERKEEAWAAPPAAPPAKPSAAAKSAPRFLGDDKAGEWEAPRMRARRYVPMRRVWDKKVSFAAASAFAPNAGKVSTAESALLAAPNSRDKTAELFSLYSTLGRIGEAQDLTAKWAGRDALDPDAILARADLAARQGDRDRAIRILGGLADVRPGDRAIQTRLADLQDAAGNPALACEHRITLADLAPSEAKLVAAAMSCARAIGQVDLASALRFDAQDKVREALDKLAAETTKPTVRGEISVSAEWAGDADVDIGLIDAQGRRTSWLGAAGNARVVGRDVRSTRGESLEISGLPQGNYVVEVTRAGAGSDPVRGDLVVRFGGETTRLPFTLLGARSEVGTVRVYFTSRLVPL